MSIWSVQYSREIEQTREFVRTVVIKTATTVHHIVIWAIVRSLVEWEIPFLEEK
jgi:hypothetical protein